MRSIGATAAAPTKLASTSTECTSTNPLSFDPEHTYAYGGNYTIRILFRDTSGESATVTVPVTVGSPSPAVPTASIDASLAPTTSSMAGDPITLFAADADDSDTYAWSVTWAATATGTASAYTSGSGTSFTSRPIGRASLA